ncbi:hypothetical protein NEOLEDRAFT_63961 [Neolentinus lepideus HHB14362 ss-1]|uniref:Uncharacterized protein n=1 Tax=Neolentinus lepideus HHB14362 ss-1 TaxID=1314782 RepID=A0A165U9C1_9AGAM|nr:hypothetical protein NEOLEDRAFT_63961 [Neolentinus lepideus HHB14362 ss-1]
MTSLIPKIELRLQLRPFASCDSFLVLFLVPRRCTQRARTLFHSRSLFPCPITISCSLTPTPGPCYLHSPEMGISTWPSLYSGIQLRRGSWSLHATPRADSERGPLPFSSSTNTSMMTCKPAQTLVSLPCGIHQ